jgi:hypothetical protein
MQLMGSGVSAGMLCWQVFEVPGIRSQRRVRNFFLPTRAGLTPMLQQIEPTPPSSPTVSPQAVIRHD